MAKRSVGTSRSSEHNKKSESIHVTIFIFVQHFELPSPFFRIKISRKLTKLLPSSENIPSDGITMADRFDRTSPLPEHDKKGESPH